MNERGHLVNAAILSVGVGVILEPSLTTATAQSVVVVAPPIILGALFPDLDTAFGEHRKTFHNVWVLLVALAFPHVFDNLHYVWIGILTHYVLDLLGNQYGMGIFYPLPGFYDIPVGVNVDSPLADVVTLLVTAFELLVLFALAFYGYADHLQSPDVFVLARDALETFL